MKRLAGIANGAATAAMLVLVCPAFAQQDDGDVRAVIVPGNGNIPDPRAVLPEEPLPRGDIQLNFPGVSAQQVARAVFGDILHVPYSIDPSLEMPVTVVTSRPIARSAVLPYMEGAFRAAGLAIIGSNGTYVITTVEQARQQASLVGEDTRGFGNEAFTLRFVSVKLLQQVLESVLPGLVTQADTGQNILTVSGTTGQRRAVRDLVERFDVNWLRNMSFAVYVPRRTDARLIVPELEKLVDSPGAPTAGLVKLIAMERLNGILAVSSQPQYLEDVKRWVDILDREGENSQPRLFVYRVQNGRSACVLRAGRTRRRAARRPACSHRIVGRTACPTARLWLPRPQTVRNRMAMRRSSPTRPACPAA
jgi:general secretion pathway protein D